MSYHYNIIQTLEYWGLSDILVPFLLVFTVVFAILENIKLFPAKRFHVVIALAMALGVIIPHLTNTYPAEADVVNIINQSLPSIGVIVIGILMALLLIGTFGWKYVGGKVFPNLIAIAAFVVVTYIFGRSAGWFQYGFLDWLYLSVAPETWTLLTVLLVFGLIVYFIVADEGEKGAGQKGLEILKDIFGGQVK